MTVTKERFIDGLLSYMKQDVIKNVPDSNMKILLGTAVYAVKNNPTMVDNFLTTHPMIQTILLGEGPDGCIDVDKKLDSLASAIAEYGNLTFTIPSIPLISKDEKTLSFSSTDVHGLKRYFESGSMII